MEYKPNPQCDVFGNNDFKELINANRGHKDRISVLKGRDSPAIYCTQRIGHVRHSKVASNCK